MVIDGDREPLRALLGREKEESHGKLVPVDAMHDVLSCCLPWSAVFAESAIIVAADARPGAITRAGSAGGRCQANSIASLAAVTS